MYKDNICLYRIGNFFSNENVLVLIINDLWMVLPKRDEQQRNRWSKNM